MKKYQCDNYNKLKIIINVLVSIVLLYGAFTYAMIHDKNLKGDFILTTGSLVLIGLIVIGHVSVLIHEVGHVIAIKNIGSRIKVFQVGPVKYINDDNDSKLVFNKIGLLIIGGYVIPEVSRVVYDESTLRKFSKQYIKFIFSGIILTILILIIASILLICKKAMIMNFLIVVVNWAILIKSLDNENLSYGDLYLIKLLKEEPEYICAVLQNNLILEYPVNPFLKTKIEEFLLNSINKDNYNELILGLADKILDNYIIEENEIGIELKKLKQWLFSNYEVANSYNSISKLTIVKVSYKFMLYEYIFGIEDEFSDNYNKIIDFVSKNPALENYELIKEIIRTSKLLYKNTNILEENFKYTISDLEFLVGESNNYRRKVSLIVDKIVRKNTI